MASAPAGISDPSNEVVVKGAEVPDAPSNLAASGEGSSVSLTWSAPAGQVSGYVIEAGSAPGRRDVGTLNVGAATAFGTTAAPGVYYVRVRAVNAQGVGAASNEDRRQALTPATTVSGEAAPAYCRRTR